MTPDEASLLDRRHFLGAQGLGWLAGRSRSPRHRRTIPGPGLRVMTFNVRYDARTLWNHWTDRRAGVCQIIQRHAPDVLGTQEGLFHQLVYMSRHLEDYQWIGLGREGGSRGEFMAVFYRTDRLEPLEFDHFWLSDTPHVVGSRSFGNRVRRMVTWVRFREVDSEREFLFVNTHLDHQVQEARMKSARLILSWLDAQGTRSPVVLVGDFNAEAEQNEVYAKMVNAGFSDAWRLAIQHTPTAATFHGFRGPKAATRRIDWILFRGAMGVQAARVITDEHDGQYPSDHFPVVADLTFAR